MKRSDFFPLKVHEDVALIYLLEELITAAEEWNTKSLPAKQITYIRHARKYRSRQPHPHRQVQQMPVHTIIVEPMNVITQAGFLSKNALTLHSKTDAFIHEHLNLRFFLVQKLYSALLCKYAEPTDDSLQRFCNDMFWNWLTNRSYVAIWWWN